MQLEEHVKPQAKHILNHFYLQNLRQNGQPLNWLIENSRYLSELHNQLLRSDTLMFSIDFNILRKKCIAEGNELTFKKAGEVIRSNKATSLQLQAMTSKADTTQASSLRRAKGNA